MAGNTNFGFDLKKASTTVGEITSLTLPEITTEAAEKTNHASAGYREFIPSGLLQVGEFSASINVPATTGVDSFITDMVAKTVATYTITFPTGTSIHLWSFSAFVTGVKIEDADAQSPDVLKATITFQPSGALTNSGV